MFADDNERKLFVEGTTPLQKINVEQIDTRAVPRETMPTIQAN